MLADKIVIAVFTGTGNTLVAAKAMAERFEAAGKSVAVVPVERFDPAGFGSGAALGLAVPVACFTTYPTVWRFIENLPEGGGREAFFLATMGGFGGGMQGPIGRALERKGYRPAGARLLKVGGNYGNDAPQGEQLAAVIRKAREDAGQYAEALLAGNVRWGGRWANPFSGFFAWLGRGKKSFKMFRRVFPLAVDAGKCTGCGLCEKLCPEQNIVMREGVAAIGDNCESCQRCIGFCPAGAIGTPGKQSRQYRSVTPAELLALLQPGGATVFGKNEQ